MRSFSSRQVPLTVTEVARTLGAGSVVLVDPGGVPTALVNGAWVYESDAKPSAENQLALLVGIGRDTEAAVIAMGEAAARGCVGVVVDGPLAPTAVAPLRKVARTHRVALFRRCAEVSWLTLADAVRNAVRERFDSSADLVGSVAPGDLAGLAEGLADMLGGPVIIEDADFQVLAFSTWTGDVDHGRDAAILGGHIPDEWLQHLEDEGVLETLLSSDEVIDVENGPFHARRRLLRSIRVDNQLIGILWVAEGDRPLGDHVATAMDLAARVTVPHLLRYRDEIFGQRSAHRRVLRALVETGEVSHSMAEDLGLVPARAYAMVALRRTNDASLTHAERRRLVESVDIYCQSYRWRAAASAVGHTIYCLLALGQRRQLTDVLELARGLADNARRTLRFDVWLGVSDERQRLVTAPELRTQVDSVLAVLSRSADTGHAIMQFSDAMPQIMLDRLSDLARDNGQERYYKLDALFEHDELYGTDYVETLTVYLEDFGNTAVAARRLDLHPTTLRYRLRRITELSGLALDSADERLYCALFLRRS